MDYFKTKIIVPYYEINRHREASAAAVFNYLEEAAIRHSETVGCGIDWLLSQSLGWMLTRWSLKIERYPKWQEIIEIKTWPSNFERFYATREFTVTGSSGELIGLATSRWIFLDLNRKRPVRIPAEIISRYGFDPVRALEDDFPDLSAPDDRTGALPFRVRQSDIDTNEHVNNTRYVEWMMETVPPDAQHDFFPYRVEVAYKRETEYGATVMSAIIEQPGLPGEKRFIHRISGQSDGTDLATAQTLWRKR